MRPNSQPFCLPAFSFLERFPMLSIVLTGARPEGSVRDAAVPTEPCIHLHLSALFGHGMGNIRDAGREEIRVHTQREDDYSGECHKQSC